MVCPCGTGDGFTFQYAPKRVNGFLIINRGALQDFVNFPSGISTCRFNCQWNRSLDYLALFMTNKPPREVIHQAFKLGNPELHAQFQEILAYSEPATVKRSHYLEARTRNRLARRKR